MNRRERGWPDGRGCGGLEFRGGRGGRGGGEPGEFAGVFHVCESGEEVGGDGAEGGGEVGLRVGRGEEVG